MVLYQCNNCLCKFTKKCNYDRHMLRKMPCCSTIVASVADKIITCHKCGTVFSRIDNLHRHLKICKHKAKITNNVTSNIDININGGQNDIHTGDNIHNENNTQIIINNHNYNLYAFGKEPHDELSLSDKINIFTSKIGPVFTIIFYTNLDPDKKNWHNVGYTDPHSACGLTYDGNKWENDCIHDILQNLLENNGKWLPELFEDVRQYMTAEGITSTENILNNLDNILYPRTESQAKSKKRMLHYLKTYFYNNRFLVLQAKKYTEQNTEQNMATFRKNIHDPTLLLNGFTAETIQATASKINKTKKIKQEIGTYLLNNLLVANIIASAEYGKIYKLIQTESSISNIDIIIKLLSAHLVTGLAINIKIITDKIKLEQEIDRWLCAG